MKSIATLVLLLLLSVHSTFGQAFTYQWIPTNSPPSSFRFEDVYFLNADTGWAVNLAYAADDGYVMRTYDGGVTWDKVWDSVGIAFRDIGFTDALHGWIGTLEHGINPEDTIILYQTTDGGDSWSPVQNLPGPRPAGICGLQVINDSTVYAVGRYPGPAGFYKTTDNGLSWAYTDCSPYAGGLVDLYFFNPDTGFAVGTNGNWFTGKGRIISTTDAGATWTVAHTSAHINEICWKLSFPSQQVGYVSLQAFNNTGWQYFLKTTDGGITWADMNLSNGGGPNGSYNVQGIRFLNDSVGWIGGDAGSFFTQDGGATWVPVSEPNRANRFRMLNDTTGYVSGSLIYKLLRVPVGLVEPGMAEFTLRQNYPNPFRDVTVIEYFVPVDSDVRLMLYDVMGNAVAELVNAAVTAGNHRLVWSVEGVAEGVYYYTLRIGEERVTRRLVIKR
jgi:photosystem II stability/assembly factor-like uncharacterized protein